MKKSVLVVFFLLLVACQAKTQQTQPADFRFGTEGLYISFVPNLPPPRVFDRDPFNVMIQVENRGTSEVGDAGDVIYLSGFDPSIVTGINQYGAPVPLLEGRSTYVPRGGVDAVSFQGRIQSLAGKRIDKYEPTILATACYGYETVASAQVCIDPNPYAATSVQKVCSPVPVSLGSQGAPVAVSRVDVEPAPGRTRFKIVIQNVGGGDVFKQGGQYLAKCSPYDVGLGFTDIDYVQVADVMVSGESIKGSCKPLDQRDNHVRLTNGMAELYCELSSMQGQGAYLTPLNIILRYGYRQSIAQRVEIRPVS